MTASPAKNENGTTQALLQRYHTVMQRPSVEDAAQSRLLFRVCDRQLRNWLPANRGARLLDAGCGEGHTLAYLRSRGYADLEGFDFSSESVALCHQAGLDFVKQHDVLRMDAWPRTEPYDLILALDLLEHVPKEKATEMLASLRARLRPDGGTLIVRTPNMGSLFGAWALYSDLSHEFGVSEASVRHLLVLAGFSPEHVSVRPAWEAATALGWLRDLYLRVVHHAICLSLGRAAPRVPTRNLLARGVRHAT
ncbi:MAG: class I SAM-dependent methyltransferase [Verrucomicrobia bacterium]|nr:class I SAM-dependent methyltransferase [Verrucomicrobiota bacterium]